LILKSEYLWSKLKSIHGSSSIVSRESGPACVTQSQLAANLQAVVNVMNDDFMTWLKALWRGISIKDWAA
jgi:hypothetical protein